MNWSRFLFGFLLLIFSGCIGTDFIEDPVSSQADEAIEISPTDTSLVVGATFSFSAQYYNRFGEKEAKVFSWSSSNTEIAEINSSGEVTAKTQGQVKITATSGGISSQMALLTIVGNNEQLATVKINGNETKLYLTETKTLAADLFNAKGEVVNAEITWSSSDGSIVSVDENGMITPIKVGSASITATANGIKSLPHTVEILPTSLTASIVQGTVPGDRANGTATLTYSGGRLSLNLENDFSTSNGPSLFVYLTNCTSLTSSNLNECKKLEIAPLKSTSGAQNYLLPEGIYINDYAHIIIFCKPFVVTFGSGMFK
jgi:hypothetical protein